MAAEEIIVHGVAEVAIAAAVVDEEEGEDVDEAGDVVVMITVERIMVESIIPR